MTYPKFTNDILRMNGTYELPTIPTTAGSKQTERLHSFHLIIQEEVNEMIDVMKIAGDYDTENAEAVGLDVRVQLADLLGDIIVYCASEAERWNIPLADVLRIIMASNFSKLDENGRPIKDERGKFLKGPNYWKPEPQIKELLQGGGAFTVVDGRIVPLDMAAIAAAANQPKETKKEQP